ncbi:hydroxymethylglutaryl-CoA synthase [Companilactobacillus nodensis DSM 19682 = JCM 14932 = NBRC 107160]|uniref:Hydroxymethylglutaryl-CoA synthase n=1 Tax=Companilactobacillus nodensis DSM 19682 = JCM 14932 = NBRC 107160 TaxID=1423775 RepID=A0A0R1K6E8_9LACO|nr:hydroxymethylglutaryl-CoA synthase [Companilactobacillus nodensis]KRK79215.1 hydroxymethylglutaryl-CoA synthase [Companilactobacillus nodensis DSM 19682 = JCM 14932 = NBRC 107160]
MDVGIDRLGFYTPKKYIDIVELAEARDVDPNKFTIGIGQSKQAVPDVYQDAVTMAAEAADKVLDDDNRNDIGLVIVGTESSVDESKATSAFLMDLLDLPEDVRAFEIKEACYGATAGLQMAYNFVAMNPDKKALVIASDIARYGIKTPGEVTQGAGAVSMIVSQNPHILKLDNKSVYMSRNVGDFWRPTFSKTAFARGKYSNEIYVEFFTTLWKRFQEKYDMTAEDFDTMLFHIPYTKMGMKALRTLDGQIPAAHYDKLVEHYQKSIEFSRNVGNLYTGSLYLGLISYLVNGNVQPDEKLMLFSYGSGAVGEIYSAEVVAGFDKYLDSEFIKEELNNRQKISVPDYETIFSEELENAGITKLEDVHDKFYLSEIKESERLYKKVN